MLDSTAMLSNERPERTHLDHSPPSWSPDNATYSITICTQPRGVNVLCQPETAKSILDSIIFYHQQKSWFCELALLMPDHLHALLVFPSDKPMTKTIQNWKRYTAKTLSIPWQRDFFDHRLRNEKKQTETWHYIRQNPVRAGLITHADDWPHFWQASR